MDLFYEKLSAGLVLYSPRRFRLAQTLRGSKPLRLQLGVCPSSEERQSFSGLTRKLCEVIRPEPTGTTPSLQVRKLRRAELIPLSLRPLTLTKSRQSLDTCVLQQQARTTDNMTAILILAGVCVLFFAEPAAAVGSAWESSAQAWPRKSFRRNLLQTSSNRSREGTGSSMAEDMAT